MSFPVLLLYVYGVLLILGGVMGYVKAKSVPSLVAGGLCGLIALLLGYYYTWHFAPHAALLLSVRATGGGADLPRPGQAGKPVVATPP